MDWVTISAPRDGGGHAGAEAPVTVREAAERDFEPVLELLAGRSRRLHAIAEVTADGLRHAWGRAAWVADADGQVVGYAALDAAHELELIGADPAAEDALLDRSLTEARARGYDTVLLTAPPEDEAAQALVRRRGFALDRTILRMWQPLDVDLPAAAWPDGVSVRTYRDADAAPVKELLDRAYGGWDGTYVVRPLDDWRAWMTGHDEFDPELWFLVERAGALVACALYWAPYQGRGWLKDLVVEESERGRGLGRALLAHGARAYRERGVERIGLKVDASNPTGAPQLYERAGFRVDRRSELWLTRP